MADPPPSTPLHVLVVDDEAPVRRVLSRLLERDGHRVDEAESGEAALAGLGEGAAYDVILSDIHMPGVSGREFLTRLRERAPELADRVVFITGDAHSAAAEQLPGKAPAPVIGKPFDFAEVRRVLERVGRASRRS